MIHLIHCDIIKGHPDLNVLAQSSFVSHQWPVQSGVSWSDTLLGCPSSGGDSGTQPSTAKGLPPALLCLPVVGFQPLKGGGREARSPCDMFYGHPHPGL